MEPLNATQVPGRPGLKRKPGRRTPEGGNARGNAMHIIRLTRAASGAPAATEARDERGAERALKIPTPGILGQRQPPTDTTEEWAAARKDRRARKKTKQPAQP